jgi:hypothetical protein
MDKIRTIVICNWILNVNINTSHVAEEEGQDWGAMIPQVGKCRGLIRGLRG